MARDYRFFLFYVATSGPWDRVRAHQSLVRRVREVGLFALLRFDQQELGRSGEQAGSKFSAGCVSLTNDPPR